MRGLAGWIVSGVIAVAGLFYAIHSHRNQTPSPLPLESFRDCTGCPEMVVVPAGSFVMGSEAWPRKPVLTRDAQPRRTVTISKPFAVGKFEVTFDEWALCVADGGCGHRPDDEGFGRGPHPVLNVSWDDAQEFVGWLSRRTGGAYRLLTEAEWEYVARAGTATPFPWGRRATHAFANFGEPRCCKGAAWGRDQWLNTAPVGQFPPNGFGLHDTQGNVYEWVQDCYVRGYDAAPVDGSAVEVDSCPWRGIRGGAWYSDPGRIRSSYRAYQTQDKRDRVIGFRVAKTL